MSKIKDTLLGIENPQDKLSIAWREASKKNNTYRRPTEYWTDKGELRFLGRNQLPSDEE